MLTRQSTWKTHENPSITVRIAPVRCRESHRLWKSTKLLLKKIGSEQTERAVVLLSTPNNEATSRFRENYRRLGALTKREAISISITNNCNASLDKTVFFSTIITSLDYRQVEIVEGNFDKTVFTAQYPLHQFICMTFGFQNTRCKFQPAMDVTLAAMKRWFALVDFENGMTYLELQKNTSTMST